MNVENPHGVAERLIERSIFAARWLLAPLYLGLTASLLLLLATFAQKAWKMASHVGEMDSSELIVGLLSLVDLSLMANLILIVTFAGYENFVSRMEFGHRDRPAWMGQVSFSDLKVKLLASIVAISAIQLLEGFMNVAQTSDRELAWEVGIHLTFVVSGVLLAWMDRISGEAGDGH